MSQDSNPNEVTIFHDSAVFENPVNDAIDTSLADIDAASLQAEEEQRMAADQENEAEVAAAALALETVNAESTHGEPQQSTYAPTSVTVNYVKLRPATALLIIRLLGLGLCILLFLFLIGLFFDMLTAIFGGSSVGDNRYFLLLMGVIFYMIAGWVLYEQWSHILYTVYRDRIVVEKGWIMRNKQTLDIKQFGGAVVEQGLLGKLFKYGSIRLLFSGAIGKAVGELIADIADPFENYQMMNGLIRGHVAE